jgi:predicted alternative tryptophan synthase beta-subunit
MSKIYSNKDLKHKIEPPDMPTSTQELCLETGHVVYESTIIIDETAYAEFEKLPEQIKKFWRELQTRKMNEMRSQIEKEMLDGVDRF